MSDLHKETLAEVQRLKASMREVKSAMTEADFTEVMLGLESIEFFLSLKEINKAIEELYRTLVIVKRYNGDDGAIGSFTRL